MPDSISTWYENLPWRTRFSWKIARFFNGGRASGAEMIAIYRAVDEQRARDDVTLRNILRAERVPETYIEDIPAPSPITEVFPMLPYAGAYERRSETP